MKKKEVFRLYPFSDGKLVTIGKEKIAFMRRDKGEYSRYGITSADFDALDTALDAFSDTTTDIELVNSQKDATLSKDIKGVQLREAIRTVMSHVVLKFPGTTPKYKKFGTDALSQQSDSQLLITAKRVARVGNEFFTEIEPHGLTAAMLDNITNLRDEFEDMIVDVKLRIGERDTQQEERVEKANAIYKTLVKYTQTGLSIWANSDVAKYNDYIIYNTASGEQEPDMPASDGV